MKTSQHVDDLDEGGDPSEVLTRKAHEGIQTAKGRRGRDDSESELDFDIKGVNEFKPSAMAVTFLAGSGSSSLNVRVTGAAYRIFGVSSGARKWKWWARDPHCANVFCQSWRHSTRRNGGDSALGACRFVATRIETPSRFATG